MRSCARKGDEQAHAYCIARVLEELESNVLDRGRQASLKVGLEAREVEAQRGHLNEMRSEKRRALLHERIHFQEMRRQDDRHDIVWSCERACLLSSAPRFARAATH